MDSDKVPFYVTLALAIVGWYATYIVQRITVSPTLEYEISTPTALSTTEHPNAKRLTVQLTNLTRATTFKNLTIVFISPENTEILEGSGEMHPVPPAFEGDEPWKYQGGIAQHVIPRVHPGWEFSAQVGFTGEKPPVVRFNSEDPIYLTEPSVETWFVRKELWIFLASLSIWVIAMLLFARTRGRTRKQEGKDPPRVSPDAITE